MKQIVQIVTLQDPGIVRGLIRYINTCCDLLFGDDWTSRAVGWSPWTHGV